MSEPRRLRAAMTVAFVLAAGCGCLVQWQFSRVESARTECVELAGRIADGRRLIESIPALEQKGQVACASDATLRSILPSNLDANTFIRELRETVERAGVTVVSIRKLEQRGESRDGLERAGYTLLLDACSFQILDFLRQLEFQGRLVSIKSLHLDAPRMMLHAEHALPRHRVSMDLETYAWHGSQAEKSAAGLRLADIDDPRFKDLVSQRIERLRPPAPPFKGDDGRRDPFLDPRLGIDPKPSRVVAVINLTPGHATDDPAGPTEDRLRLLAAEMSRLLEEGSASLALAALDPLLLEIDQAAGDPGRSGTVEAIRSLQTLAQTIQVFDGIQLSITGTGRMQGSIPVALVNGRVVAEGEPVEEGLLLHRIGREQVEFVFRGVVLARSLEETSRL